ncbi:ABC transporter ATP-binding protein [Nocardioides albus]|uniref:ABC-type dipeptide/oligopeptide/nickel transport system ATPase component n=1 Tax=Nocardioides albus TaxID=1841 RepID=A0A7W5A3F7_9ACTN|nr:ABC transporter ATP-binding protein [Nocardioides albus]MBB3088987.1 ABC-type dipeptide/oligopeptide/nickel transport system ATPase component [Nocardioides albus]GGU14996.1 ABC transporter ATP-binding protein [Nocardioides albus]
MSRASSSAAHRVPDGPVLSVRDLIVDFGAAEPAVNGVSLDLWQGRILGVAGQSGSGKSMTALTSLGLAPPGAHITGSIRFRDQELVGVGQRTLSRVRGSGMTMIFQETNAALNPVIQVRKQLTLAVRANRDCNQDEAHELVVDALRDVRLDDTDRVLNSYPHELSGGMAQRVMIAMALVCGADVIFADEPTTALDVTVQREVMEIIRRVADEHRLAVMLISHDIGVLEEISDELAVMYRGRVVERGSTDDVIRAPEHPYTRALLDSIPRIGHELTEFVEMPSFDMDLTSLPAAERIAEGSHS